MEIGNPMDTVQQQISTLNHKVDGLYKIIEQLNQHLAQCLPDIKAISNLDSKPDTLTLPVKPISVDANLQVFDSVGEHKDILIEDYGEVPQTHNNGNHHAENPLSADVQVQRLTAQLTAAYNRIAALEEQLLARRIHS